MNDHNPADLMGLLEMQNVFVTWETVRGWTAAQCKEAREWATARWAAQSVVFSGTLKPIPRFLLDHHKGVA